MLLNRLNGLSLLRLVPMINPEPLISILKQRIQSSRVRQLHALIRHKTTHQLRSTQRHGISPINLPEMICLSIDRSNVLHLSRLGGFPCGIRHARRRRHNKHATLDLELVRMPEPPLHWRKSLENARRNHVFHADEAGVRLW